MPKLSVPASLQQAIRQSTQRKRMISLWLTAPLTLYIALFFLLPIGMMFYRAVANPEMIEAMPRTVKALAAWQRTTALPPAEAYQAVADDLIAAGGSKPLGELARRLNYEASGYRSLILKTARQLSQAEAAPDMQLRLAAIDARWSDPEVWHALRRLAPAYTPYYLLTALDLRVTNDGGISRVPADQRIYLNILFKTVKIAFIVTLLCLLLGYPLAALMVKAPKRLGFLLLMAVLLPFWTSLLARTTAWIVVLQNDGLVNKLLLALHLIDQPAELIFNATGLYIVMVHILLPFMVLPIYSAMKGVAPHFMRASASLGAHPVRGFFRIYLPLTMPGVGAGALLTFIVAAGYYVTPSLVGGAKEQMLGYFIAFYTNTTINWGMASALGIVMLSCIMLIYLVAARSIGVRQIVGLR
ncbi:putative spermidine/putrescine transport system permease protein [Collimonas sp. PA-H2]|uniref:ABC transporter permease n=1 Tax=Collimonas sp. PA-H2 TaxID=1881062 RepID=UPI000BF61314|nr:ABC transporter permease [Collimonas sp. PA-H2]PFH11634.1 putative spermidine/putrescine transport system permease protein [Collimonas sp. PA-H2]